MVSKGEEMQSSTTPLGPPPRYSRILDCIKGGQSEAKSEFIKYLDGDTEGKDTQNMDVGFLRELCFDAFTVAVFMALWFSKLYF